MRRAVLMTRQAISPRLAIRMRLNMLFLSLRPWAGPSPGPFGPMVRAVICPWYSKLGRRQRSKSAVALGYQGSESALWGSYRFPKVGLGRAPHQLVNKAELPDHRGRQDEGIEVARPHRPVDAVDGKGEGKQYVDEHLVICRP